MSFGFPAIDGHVHIRDRKCLSYLPDYREKFGLEAIGVACLSNYIPKNPTQNILTAILKLRDRHIYMNGGVLYPTLPLEPPFPAEYDFAAQAEELLALGSDGIKMLEGKPTTRKVTGLSVADGAYDGFFSLLERRGTHIVWHACDPETFWDADRAPAFAFEEGWFYGDGSYPSNDELYAEVYAVLDAHPGLNVSFAHFFFLSDFPERAEELLKKYKNVSLDITPGREMYQNFPLRRDFWHEFFIRYSDRIVLGTDMDASEFQGPPDKVLSYISRFLSTGDTFEAWDFTTTGLALPREAVENICRNNFLAMTGERREIDRDMLKAYIDKNLEFVPDEADRAFIADYRKKM